MASDTGPAVLQLAWGHCVTSPSAHGSIMVLKVVPHKRQVLVSLKYGLSMDYISKDLLSSATFHLWKLLEIRCQLE